MRFTKNQTLSDFQNFINQTYGLPDDRLFSLWDLLSNQERFTMRALKGIRKGDHAKLKHNLLIAISWFMGIINRLHIDLETIVWQRFPAACSYCGHKPCHCKIIKPKRRKNIKGQAKDKPKTFQQLQKMFNAIYPAATRTLPDAGVHLAEEMGELNEAIQIFLGEHKNKQFQTVEQETADYLSCLFGVANSAKIDISAELARIYKHNCHVCHHAPCTCGFSSVAGFKS
jgi:NTP pyrophosphatase (non-canonical NTP hydrolase)